MPAKASPAKSAKSAPPAVQAKPPKKGDHVFLVDGSSYIFRAYHALPPLNRKSDGLQVNAVLGFCNMLWKLMRDMKPDEQPTHLAVVFDKSERTFRTEMYPDYKAHRPEPPDDLRPQFPLIREAVRAFDIPCLEQAVFEKFGVRPEKVIEVQALIGDSTDNVPGVPGIGVKTAAQLIGEYGDLETLLARAAEIKQEKRRQSLIDNAGKARLSKRLVTLDDKVKLDVPLVDLAVHEPEYKRLIAFLKAMEFNTLTRRVAEFSGVDAAEIEANAEIGPGARPIARRTAQEDAKEATKTARAAPTTSATPMLPLEGGAMKLKERPKGVDEDALTPQALASVRLDAGRNAKVDRARYETVRTLKQLKEWVARAIDLGVVAIGTQATSIDPMQTALVGF